MSIIIKEKNKEIVKKIEEAILKELYSIFRAKARSIKNDIASENVNIWKKTDTYKSLISGRLTHEFGIPKGTAQDRVDYILNVFGESISVIPKISLRKRKGVRIILDINVFTKRINEEIFEIPQAIVKTGKKAANDLSDDFGAFGAVSVEKELPWLRWLLYEGNEYIILNHTYRHVSSERSRSGKGLMFKTPGEHWKVPARHSGTRNSHWLTRALRDNEDFLISEYGTIIEKHLKDA